MQMISFTEGLKDVNAEQCKQSEENWLKGNWVSQQTNRLEKTK